MQRLPAKNSNDFNAYGILWEPYPKRGTSNLKKLHPVADAGYPSDEPRS